ncbi:MAG: alpha-galactosidase [Lachnospiraceae bacterium]|nr:alpha-galactosidase [Lachnospiraceae bacterium]
MNNLVQNETQNISSKPSKLPGKEYQFDSFSSDKVLLSKKKQHLPAMGWNSWNAFGSGNTAALTRAMADQMVALGLDKLGYQYLVLDDGCYKPERVNGLLSNEDVKFPEGFRALSDYIHSKGLKFGMYNDIGTNLCAGAAVGTCGHEMVDAKSYIDWGVDFLKVDNCYYLWDNATFSDATNAKYVYTPNIQSIRLVGSKFEQTFDAVADGKLTGLGGRKVDGTSPSDDLTVSDSQNAHGYVTGIGTFDGTNTGTTPIGPRSCELVFDIDLSKAGSYQLFVTYATGQEVGIGSWLQLAANDELIYDDFLPATETTTSFRESDGIALTLREGTNKLRLMNHRRQENTLLSYAKLLEGLNAADPNHDVIFSICEWGKTQPQNWGYKVGDSWRILNDITFCVGRDGDPGRGTWFDPGTPSVTSQYDKAVIMDEFAGLDKGWNDPDMMMIGMNGLDETMCKTHMAMWCMMNSPLMLGLDLRRVEKGDWIWNIISNQGLIALNQDAHGIQAKRIYTTKETNCPDMDYITEHDRVDVLAKPLADGSVALSFINLNNQPWDGKVTVDTELIVKMIGKKMATGPVEAVASADAFATASSYQVTDLWTQAISVNETGVFEINHLDACDNVTLRIKPN